ncbi:hypothetical protein V496_00086 [Pseudogymnoascus sp. VKM F-4515 (FW-2607)]|nr:hypothetical protein V498_10685 [Pseudogymnoascus sp. VKM F-4517 (FW-2822)]KFY69632.1 hypothetical protein V496_00086 [Pseudogymnoascus sp. VKM F-4515 (FW-2607)]
MQSFNLFCYATAGWLVIQATPLIVSPRIIVALLSNDIHQPNSLETYLARSLGLTLIPFAILFLFLSGAFPLDGSSSLSEPEEVQTTPFTTPTLLVAGLYHTSISFYTYALYSQRSTSQFSYLLAATVSGVLAALGLWSAMFGNGGHISKRTGADKRTSGWPFKNTVEKKRRKGKGMQQEDIELKEM